jgi:hypothetical protein
VIRLAPPVATPSPLRYAAARTERKIALCGSHSGSLTDAPWTDPSWEWWGHASSRAWYSRPMDRYFDLHPRSCWSRGGKKTAAYPRWLAANTVPILMQDRYPEVPASVKYPKGRILLEFADARAYFTNHVAWMIALALTEGVTTIGLFGVNYGTEGEYQTQRGSAEYWLGRAAGKGVRIVLPEQCTLLREPALLYGYESHDVETGQIKAAYKRKEWKPVDTIRPLVLGVAASALMEPPKHLRAEIEAEEREHPRPSWAFRAPHEYPGPQDAQIVAYEPTRSVSAGPGEVVVVPDNGQTVYGADFSARLVAMNVNGATVVPADGMTVWKGTHIEAPGNEEV